ncbi:MAG: hypothetical protein WCJ56_00835 [bacterium]
MFKALRGTHKAMRRSKLIAMLLGLLLLMGAALPGFAAAPTAGTILGNQATATYVDGAGITRTVTSNVVNTTVLPVASLTLTPANTKYSNAGGLVTFPHTITNNGNSNDSFTLSYANGAGDFNLQNVLFYPDVNGDGVADAGALPITTTPPVAPGGVYTLCRSRNCADDCAEHQGWYY